MGEVFAGRYELIDMIGEGGMGAVWRVRDLKKNRIIAAKVLRQSDAGSLLRFMREQGMRIHHPNVVTPLGWAGEDDQVLFTMPIVEGGSVSTLMGDYGTLPPRYAAELIRQMLTALRAVHDAGVVHRDVKPANLLLDATGTDRPHLWLTDFGVAVSVDAPRLTSLSVVMGTPGYLAPEQLRGADPDPRSDLYAAGMVAFQMVTGHRPRPHMRSERLDLPPRPDGVPESLWDLLIRLADPDPSGRPQSAAEAIAALERPELAWHPQAEVEVFRHMPELTGVSEGEFLRPDDTQAQGGGTVPVAGQPQGPTAPGGTHAMSGGGRTAQLPRPTQGTRQQAAGPGAPTAQQPMRPQHGAPTPGASTPPGSSAPVPATPRRKGLATAVLVLAPLLALLVVGLMFWQPWTTDTSGGGESAGDVVRGAACLWTDAGTDATDEQSIRVVCQEKDGRYVWLPED